MIKQYDLIIIGSGAAGLGAALYSGRYRLKTLVLGKEFGGETAKAGTIENYPGAPAVDGYELMNVMKQQTLAISTEFSNDEVSGIAKHEHCFEVVTGKMTYQTHAIIFATGAERRRLGLPNEKELTGRGVHYCVTCDGPVYGGKTIAMVGGGDASVKGAVLAAEYVNKLFLIVRGKEVSAEPINLERMKTLGDKIEVILETEVKEVVGKNKLEKVVLSRPFKGSTDLVLDGLFVEIGATPNVLLAQKLGVVLDERGHIEVDNMMQTNIDGVFAAGDVVNHFGSFKQDITAAAMGAVAATSAYNDRKVHGELCEMHAVPEHK
ncbi:MAG: thioredoxin reductase [Candidatus Zambryskibacteria bacterium CG11_big_fil_rev_8_21_14_0_20_42_18]|uniref:Thioredoxin reductase n=2 Tax=Parcubacteria group TaxID=1794811 RepID=A0A2H0RIV9_9BACT|nr:MAG: thioredoxin reductase [Candidatus Zambryskibacteria bacterium CG11_big_fil_rev_8_21_14_0_20_42_18]PIR46479.1 MAG: thioredoxin reductase [Candidatus Vogelbacteria bacterium CG10_big_fil_rev_8_21_14_0_10_45_14]PJA33111.1 MAG: thioredoxin reductase [Candidatus Zambryskibacteria bacterium CG_4_9_14_3_um_filter_42_15]